jgi:ParB family chromosome partitioning protein
MNPRLLPVPLDQIDWQDRTFAVRGFSRTDALLASLQSRGLLSPPWLWEAREGRWIIVDGFKRLNWLRAHVPDPVDCLAYAADTGRTLLWLRRLEAKMFGTPLNLAEKAQIVAQLAEILPHEQILGEYFPLLNLAPRPRAIEQWCALAHSEDLLLAALAADQVGERAALELLDWERPARQDLVALLCELRCSASIQLEIIERISEVAVGQGRTRADVLGAPKLQAILQDPNRNHRQKTQALRELLQQWRFPRLAARQQRFAADLAKAQLPGAIHLQPPPAFEGNLWQVQIQFSSSAELQNRAAFVGKFAASPELVRLISPRKANIRGPEGPGPLSNP